MYTFTQQENGSTFISIMPKDGTKIQTLLNGIASELPISLYKAEEDEILIDVERDGKPCCNFSLRQFREAVRKFVDATITMFDVDISEPGQRLLYDLSY